MFCKHLSYTRCDIVFDLSGVAGKTYATACLQCAKASNPQSVNVVTIGLAIAERRRAKIENDDLINKLRSLLSTGPGTELGKLIPKLFQSKKCNCKTCIAKMNRLGIEGCLLRRERIVNHLVSQSKKLWILSIVPEIFSRSVAETLFDKAIENTKRNAR